MRRRQSHWSLSMSRIVASLVAILGTFAVAAPSVFSARDLRVTRLAKSATYERNHRHEHLSNGAERTRHRAAVGEHRSARAARCDHGDRIANRRAQLVSCRSATRRPAAMRPLTRRPDDGRMTLPRSTRSPFELKKTRQALQLRRRSRSAYRNLSSQAALRLARRTFRGLVAGPVYRPLKSLPAGLRVQKVLGPRKAFVGSPKSRTRIVLESTAPLVAPRSAAASRAGVSANRAKAAATPLPSMGTSVAPVDLSLVDVGDAYVPVEAVVPVAFDKHLAGGIDFRGSRMTVAAHGTQNPTGVLTSNRVFFASSSTDTDTVEQAIPFGAEFNSQLRAPDSPEDLRFDFTFGADTQLVITHDAGYSAYVQHGAEVIARIPAVVARDAAGVPVPASVTVEGSTLVVHVPHRAGAYQYPVLVDPSVTQSSDWRTTACTSTTVSCSGGDGWSGWEIKGTDINGTQRSGPTYADPTLLP